jgi:purine-cytosine permease-like protein
MFTADQIVAHLVGDYILQSHWMATEKTRSHVAAGVHALTYTLPFLLVTWSVPALAVILITHFFIDRYRLARVLVWAKNWPWPGGLRWADNTATGYPAETPAWLSVWLLIIADNVLHILINGAAIALFGRT